MNPYSVPQRRIWVGLSYIADPTSTIGATLITGLTDVVDDCLMQGVSLTGNRKATISFILCVCLCVCISCNFGTDLTFATFRQEDYLLTDSHI